MRTPSRLLIASACAALLTCFAAVTRADTSAFTITNDSQLDAGLAQARATFLAMKPYVTRLDATILVPNANGTWRRGSYNPDAVVYPASCVKLAYMAAAMVWCRTHGHPYDYLDWCVRPMIVDSDNYATGDVVDQITGAPNYSTTTYDATFWAWYDQRLYTENFLASRGLLENQTILHKTYPTNSGSEPSGAELLAKDYRGGNLMQPKCSASLMLEINRGAIEPAANAYMRELLNHDRWGSASEFGFGLPPGTVYENKLGLAYDTLEDIAYVKLPNGQEFILAAFCNGFTGPEPGNPYPYDASLLGMFAETVIETLGFDAGCPAKLKIDNVSPNVTVSGAWSLGTDKSVDYDMFGDSYLYTTTERSATKSVTWNLNVPTTGQYEVCVFSPQKSTGTTVTYTVNHAAGSTAVSIDQTHCGGRWVRLGDFNFNAGQGTVVLTNKAQRTGKTVMADCVKATLWPSADPTPTPTPTPTATATATPTPTPTPTPAGKIFVQDITMTSGKTGKNYYAKATVWVKSDSGASVPGAVVYYQWSGAVSAAGNATTGADGKVTIQSPNKNGGGTFTFTVTNLEAAGYTYDPAMNVKTTASIKAP